MKSDTYSDFMQETYVINNLKVNLNMIYDWLGNRKTYYFFI